MNTPYYKVNNSYPYEGFSDFFYGKNDIEFTEVTHSFEKFESIIEYSGSSFSPSEGYPANTIHNYNFSVESDATPIFSDELYTYSNNGHVIFENSDNSYYFISDSFFNIDHFPHILNANKFNELRFSNGNTLDHSDIIKRLGANYESGTNNAQYNINAVILFTSLVEILSTDTGLIHINDIAIGSSNDDILSYEDGINDDFANSFFSYAGNDTIYTSFNENLIYSGKGDDSVILSNGVDHGNTDIIIYNLGDGNDTIEVFAPGDTILFGDGIEPEGLLIERPNLHDLLISLGNNQSILLNNFYDTRFKMDDSNKSKDAYLTFSNGEIIRFSDIIHELMTTTPESGDTIYGYRGGLDLQIEGEGDDLFILTSQGIDTVSYSLGDGNDTIELKEEILAGYIPQGGVVINLYDITLEDIEFSFNKYDTTLNFEGGGSLLIKDALNYNGYFDEPNFYVFSDSGFLNPHILSLYDNFLHPEDNNIFEGTSGNDEFFALNTPFSFDGQEGINTVNYINATSAIKVDLLQQEHHAGAATDNILVHVNNINASNFNDVVKGDHTANRLSGADGDDFIMGRAGDDVLLGGAGNDSLYGHNGDDAFYDNDGANLFDGGNGSDRIYYDDANSAVNIDLYHTQGYSGAAQYDTIYNVEHLAGSQFNDVLKGNGDDNQFDGADGNDLLLGRNGNDILNGNKGNDTLYGQSGDDTLRLSEGDDHLYGGKGADTFDFDTNLLLQNISTQRFTIIEDFQQGVDMIILSPNLNTFDTDGGETESGEIRLSYDGEQNITYVLADHHDFGFGLRGDFSDSLNDTDVSFA